MLINISKLPYNNWPENLKNSAIAEYGWVEDLLWPAIEVNASGKRLAKLANDYVEECKFMFEMANIPVSQQAYNEAVLVVGEAPFLDELTNLFSRETIKYLTSLQELSA